MMRIGLYQKFFTWAVLNLVLIGVLILLALGLPLLLSPKGIFPPALFNGGVETVIRVAAQELQYLPESQWQKQLNKSGREHGIDLAIVILDDRQPELMADLPPALLDTARSFPAPPYSLCAEPSLEPTTVITPAVALEAGIIPQQYAIFLHEHQYFWYGRTILVSNDVEEVRYALITASSPSFTGNGLFFALDWPIALLLAGLGISFLWWWPFVDHITRPVITLTHMTERIAAGDYSPLDHSRSLCGAAHHRSDQIGALARATTTMAEQVRHQVHGQRRFIRHIAHELDSPLARIKLGLAVLDSRVDSDNQRRVQEISADVEQLSILVEDVLSFMRSEAVPETPHCEDVSLRPLLDYVLRSEARHADVWVRYRTSPAMTMEEAAPELEPGLRVRADAGCLGRALANVLRNAVRYAGNDGPILVDVCRLPAAAGSGNASTPENAGKVCVTIQDSGPGVNENDLPHLTEPFYRGALSERYPGGSGLGMAIVKHCVTACGGELECGNAGGVGSTSVTASGLVNDSTAPFKGFMVRITLSAV